MLRDAEKTVTIVTTREGMNRKFEAIMPTLEKLKKRGVKVRIAAPVDESNIKVAKDFKKVAEVRDVDKLRARFIIIDSNQIMFMLLDDEKFHPNYDVGIWVNTEYFAVALEQMFELAWKDMKTVK
jgi:sugar-specific transcriptional regulator TrmB